MPSWSYRKYFIVVHEDYFEFFQDVRSNLKLQELVRVHQRDRHRIGKKSIHVEGQILALRDSIFCSGSTAICWIGKTRTQSQGLQWRNRQDLVYNTGIHHNVCWILNPPSSRAVLELQEFGSSVVSHMAVILMRSCWTPHTHPFDFTTGFVVYSTAYIVIKNLLFSLYNQCIHYKTFKSEGKNMPVVKHYREWK